MWNSRGWSISLIMLILLLGCTARPAPAEPTPSPMQVVATFTATAGSTGSPAGDAPATPAAAPVVTSAAPDLTARCPAAGEGASQHVSVENGICFLYPVKLKLGDDLFRPEEVVHLVGSLADPNAMETVAVNLSVAYNGPADGLDSAQYARMWVELNTPGMALQQEPSTISGQPAVVVDDLPGMFPQRGLFLVANGIKYQIILQPQPELVPELAEEATQAWDTVTGSISFFPPRNSRTVVRPADVCPTASAGSTLHTDLAGGYCLLHPADFAPDPNLPGAIAGGADLGSVDGFEHIRASLTIGNYPLGEQPPEQVLQPISEQIDSGSVTRTTINGYPAVVYDFTGGPWRQRNAQILVGDTVYTLVAQPWDAELFPQALPDVEQLWETATTSIAFFDQWR